MGIRNEISTTHVPGEEPFKREPRYTGPPSEALYSGENPPSGTIAETQPSASDLVSPLQEDLEDEAAMVELLLPSRSKKRRHIEDDDADNATIESSPNGPEGPPTKKFRALQKLTGFATLPSIFTFPSSANPPPSPSPITPTSLSSLRSASPSGTSTMIATESSSLDGESFQVTSDIDSRSSSPRKDFIAKKNSNSCSPFGIKDSIYLHHRR